MVIARLRIIEDKKPIKRLFNRFIADELMSLLYSLGFIRLCPSSQ